MKELADKVAKLDEELKKRIVRELKRLGAELNELLTDAATEESVTTINQDGSTDTANRTTVKTTSLRRIMRELDDIERQYNETLYDGTVDGMEAAIAVVIATLLGEIDGMSKQSKVNADKTLGKTVKIGDKTLKQRAAMLAAETTADVRSVIRQGVLGGEDVQSIVKKVRKTFSDTDWKVERLVESEVYGAYRYQFAQTTSENGFDWIRIHETFPRHPRRRYHRCYTLANADPYGRGKGVYKSTDIEIFYPHPQCTSWLEVVEALD